MNGKLFKIGQAVTPNNGNQSWETLANQKSPYPKFGEIYHVREFDRHAGYWLISLCELPERYFFQQEGFSPVVSDSVLSKELEEIFQEDLVESK